LDADKAGIVDEGLLRIGRQADGRLGRARSRSTVGGNAMGREDAVIRAWRLGEHTAIGRLSGRQARQLLLNSPRPVESGHAAPAPPRSPPAGPPPPAAP